MRTPLLKKLNNSKGFTLAETLVALAIIVILLGITMLGILGYVKNMKITEMDSTARQIFSAAQNHLTSAQVTGQLESLTSTANLGTPMSKPADFPDTTDDPKWPGDNNGEYYYIAYSPKDPTTLESSILKNMLPFGAIDEEVRKDGSYIIEYNVKTAAVYGVFYTDNEAGVESSDVAVINNAGGRADGIGRVVRRDHTKKDQRVTIGYYGGAMAQELEGESQVGLEFEIENGEKLLVKITDRNYFKKIGATQLQTQLEVTVTGAESGPSKAVVMKLDLDENLLSPRPKIEKSWWKVETILGENGEKELYYEVCLDDITTVGGHFANVCKGLIPGEDIQVAVNYSSAKVESFQPEKLQSQPTNSLFNRIIENKNENGVTARNVEIAAIRHFENLENKISNINVTKIWGRAYVKTAIQEKDLEWKNSIYDGVDEKIYPHDSRSKDVYLAKNSFYGIHAIALEKYDGQGNTMSNFVIKPEANDGKTMAGLFQSVGDYTYPQRKYSISNVKLENFDVKVQNVTGNPSDSQAGKLAAGSLVGQVNCNLSVNNVIAVDGSVVSMDYAAGGLIGEIEGGTVDIGDCAAAMTVSGRGYTGGFIGGIEGGTVTINKSYSGGRTQDGIFDPTIFNVTGKTTSGGFIGAVDAPYGPVKLTVNDCYSTCSVDANWHQAGGFIGQDTSSNSTYKNCYATGLVKNYAERTAGAFAHTLGAKADNIANCRYLEGMNGDMDGVYRWNTPGPGIKGVSYAELAKNVDNSSGETYAYDKPFYEGAIYPFPMATTAGAGNIENKIGVHYGDWPRNTIVEEIIEPTDIMFAYREEEGTGVHRWFIKGVTDNKELKIVLNEFSPGIGQANIPRDDKGTYGLLLRSNFIETNLFQGSIGHIFVETGEAVTVKGQEFWFFPLQANVYSKPSETIRIKKVIDVIIRPGFAASIETSATP